MSSASFAREDENGFAWGNVILCGSEGAEADEQKQS
jgi:hypothetical protein